MEGGATKVVNTTGNRCVALSPVVGPLPIVRKFLHSFVPNELYTVL